MAPRPPGPRDPSLVQTARYLASQTGFLESCRRRYGPVFRVQFPGFPPEVIVANAELAQTVYATDAGGSRAGVVRRQFLEPVVGRHSLLTLDHAPWWRHRRLLSPPLHGRAVGRWADQIASIAAEEIGRWPLNRPFALRDRMQDITLEVILRLVFGIRDSGRLDRLRVLIPRLIDIGSTSMMMLPPRPRDWLMRSPLATRLPLPTSRFLAVRDAVDALLFAEIAQRRAAPDPEATDVLSLLIAARDEDGRPMTDQELRDELITLLEAGHETTATGLAWMFERLLRTPPVHRRLRDDTGDGYLEAAVKEALRCRPVVYGVPRLLDEPLALGGYEVPPGWYVSPFIALIHRDPEVFPEPDEFRPERFLGDGAARANKAWMPFGGGRRYCVGAQLALMEMRVIAREILDRAELHALGQGSERARIRHVTLVPGKGTRVMVSRRLESERAPAV